MRKTKKKKKKLPRKSIRRQFSVRKKTKAKKVTKPRKTKKTVRKRRVSKFKVDRVKLDKNRVKLDKNNKDEFIVDKTDDTPIINFQPNFLIDNTNIDDLLNEVEIGDDRGRTLKLEKSLEPKKTKASKELEKLIADDYVLSEGIRESSNYSLKIKKDGIKIKSRKELPSRSQYIINLKNKTSGQKIDNISSKVSIIKSKPSKVRLLDIPRKRTIKNVSSLYLRELLFLTSKTKSFKFTHFLGKSIADFFHYVFYAIGLLFKALINFLFSILVGINSFGQKVFGFISNLGNEDYKKASSDKERIYEFKERLLNFNPILLFKQSSWRNCVRVASFIIICLLIVSSVQALSVVSKFNSTKGKVLGISEQAYRELGGGFRSIMNSDFNGARNSFSNANTKFIEAESEISKYNKIFIEILKLIPNEGNKLDDGIKLLNAGHLLSQAAEHISMALHQQNKEASLTDKIRLISENLLQSEDKLKQARNSIIQVDLKIIPKEYREEFSTIKENLPLIVDNLDGLNSLFKIVLDIFGDEIPKRYLMIFQNSNELRPTGGFIGSLALVDVKQGDVVNIEVPKGGPYDFKAGFYENVIAPKPLWLVNPNFNFWDMNWFAHFPASAELILKYFEKSGGPTVDGLIALNSNVMVELLKIIGPIQLEEYGLEINSDNFLRKVQEIVEVKYNRENNEPKAIIGDMMAEVLDRVFKDKNLNYLEVLRVFDDCINRKDIQMYFTDPVLESNIDNYGWSGAIIDTSKDYLNVVNTNIGGGKTDEFIKQEIFHHVNFLSNGTIIDIVKIKRKFIAQDDNPFSQTKNRNYMRIYVPIGSKLLEAIGFEAFPEDEYMQPIYGSEKEEQVLEIQGRYLVDELSGVKINDEFNKTVFSGWQEIKPGEEKEIYLRYELPFKLKLENKPSLIDEFFRKGDSVNLDTYTVCYDKQSGIVSDLKLNYDWSDGLELVWSNFEENNFKTVLDENKVTGLILKK